MSKNTFALTSAGWRDDRLTAYFGYRLETENQVHTFEETLTFTQPIPEVYAAEKLLQLLHFALALSYYKTTLAPEITHPYACSDAEAEFWNDVMLHGLGEFLYKNKLSADRLAKFSTQEGLRPTVQTETNLTDKAVLGIGGGKDSIVAGELLKKAGIPLTGFVLASGEVLGQTQAVAHIMNIPLHNIKRVIDPALLELNKQPGIYNGHIPISLIFALCGAMQAIANHSKFVVVANEASSSLPQATWEDRAINHQWSKSLEFEKKLQFFLQKHVHPELVYFSAIRPLTSVAVSKLFAAYPQYFSVFTSDNSVFKIVQQKREHPRWSLTSSKSLSSFILLSAWIDSATLSQFFGRNFLEETSLESLLIDILGGGEPVLDCVGTPQELQASLVAAKNNGNISGNERLYVLANQHGLLASAAPIETHLEQSEDALPESLRSTLQNTIKELL